MQENSQVRVFSGEAPSWGAMAPRFKYRLSTFFDFFFLETLNDFSSCFIDPVKNMDTRVQSSLGTRLLHQFLHQLNTGKNDALTRSSDMREESVFDGIIFRALWGKVGNTDFNPNVISKRLEVLFENIVS